MNWLWNLLEAFFSFLTGLFQSSAVKAVVKVVGEVMKQIPPELPGRVMHLVVEAGKLDGSGEDKFAYVFDCLRLDYPDLPTNVLKSLIENTLMVARKG